MSIASELRELVVKWGGKPGKDDDSIAELIAVLKNLDAPGGSGALVVNLVEDPQGEVYVCDKTAGEMFEAMEQSGVVIKQNVPSGTVCKPIVYAQLLDKVGNYIFTDYDHSDYQALSADDYPSAPGK